MSRECSDRARRSCAPARTAAFRPRRSAAGWKPPTSNTARSSPTTSAWRAAGANRSAGDDRSFSGLEIRCLRCGHIGRLRLQLPGELLDRERSCPEVALRVLTTQLREYAPLL